MKDLIEKLEKATGPRLELDQAIALAIEPTGSWSDWPRFTGSIETAMTELLPRLPDDFGAGVLRSSYPLAIPDTGPRWTAEVWNIRERTAKDYQQNLAQMKIYSGKHVSPAIAFCIAVLKTLEAMATARR